VLTASDFNLLYVSTIPRLGVSYGVHDMLFNADKSRFSNMNIKIHLSVMAAGQKRKLLSLLFKFLILFRRKDIAFCTAFDK
jgi:hypothetical protein